MWSAPKLLLSSILLMILAGCTNYKALYIQTKQELDDCLNAPKRDQIFIEPGPITIPTPAVVQTDTILIPETDTVVVRVPNPFGGKDTVVVRPQFEHKRTFFLESDSLKIWISLLNQYRNAKLIQKVKLDSFQTPVKRIIRLVKMKERIRDYNIWKVAFIGSFFGVVLFVFLLVLYGLRRRF